MNVAISSRTPQQALAALLDRYAPARLLLIGASEFPALAARELGLGDVPLMCSVEMAVAGSMPRVIRLMMHVETKLSRSEIKHVYLRGATALRADLAQ